MSDWISLDPELLSTVERTEEPGGVEVVIGLSPFDIPEKVRGGYNEKSNRFVIEFKYIDESERHVPTKLDNHITVLAGENSNRLYEIQIDVDAIGARSVQLSLATEAIERVANKSKPRKQKLYGMAKRIVESKESELVLG